MGLSRSTYYDEPAGQPIEQARLIERIKEICAEWPYYGYRRVTAQLDAEGILVNHKKVMRLMREHGANRASAPTFCGHHRQRPRWADLPEPCERRCAGKT